MASDTSMLPKLEMYDDDHSLFCTKLRIALLAKSVPFTSLSIPCAGTKSPEYLAINPLGKVPALLVQEPGQSRVAIIESDVIAEWLDERFPEHGMGPLLPPLSDPVARARCRILARFHDDYLQAALRKTYTHVDPARRDPAVIAAAVQELQLRTQQLVEFLEEAGPGPFAVGDRLTLADLGYPPCFHYIDLIIPAVNGGKGIVWPPRIITWRAALDAVPAVQAAMTTLRPAAQAWLSNKLSSSTH